MKKLSSLFFLFTLKFALGQNVNISGDKDNIVYIGVDNSLTISVGNLMPNQVIVKVDKGQIFGGYGKTYIYRGSEPGTVSINVYSKPNSKEIGMATFRAKYIPDPVVSLQQSKGGIIKNFLIKAVN